MTEVDLHLRINGNPVNVRAPEDAMLLEVLRERLHLPGTRFGCGQEKCGACMVLIDGKPEFSCARAASTATDRDIETVDGLPKDDPLLVSLLKHQAAQCAFCLPGIIMSAKALLKRSSRPDRSEVLSALEPHLCRCGAHQRIVKAIMSVEAS
ncbi:(2Fe-2S)-binding protein [Amorphus sp. 3PC139-8]|uniref:(2Fe-2S)-binding protein n=1 Tax=Amorphus sp. 3PC139-8 TaxID=2735676 RepID=UPI00345CC669